VARPYLGEFVSTRSDWRPPARTAAARRGDDPDATWQFANFLLADGDDLKDVVAGTAAAPGPRQAKPGRPTDKDRPAEQAAPKRRRRSPARS